MKELNVISRSCCAPGAPLLDDGERHAISDRFKALGDPTRVAIVNRLAATGETCVCELVAEAAVGQPTVSHHLRVLREAGLVESTRRGTWSYYRLVPEAVAALGAALGGVGSRAAA